MYTISSRKDTNQITDHHNPLFASPIPFASKPGSAIFNLTYIVPEERIPLKASVDFQSGKVRPMNAQSRMDTISGVEHLSTTKGLIPIE